MAEPGSTKHQDYMARALTLADNAAGMTSPNPVVGAVIVSGGKIIGEGWHRRAGGPHAEVDALRSATGPVEGATMYVTLEPCCHHGRTPPCTQALIEAGIAEVHYAIADPNPKVQGGGHRQLQTAGIRVFRGLLEPQARELNRPFFHFIQHGKPYIFAKFAMSLDGKIATRTGSSQWITGENARQEGMRLRHRCDAILVGSGTIRADNPRLTTRLEDCDGISPLRVILDSREGLDPSARVFDPQLAGSALLLTTKTLEKSRLRAFQNRQVDVCKVAATTEGFVQPEAVLETLGNRDITSLIIEGGSRTHASFFNRDLVQEVWVFIAPKMIGGNAAPGPIGGTGIETMAEARKWQWLESKRVGNDFLLRARPK